MNSTLKKSNIDEYHVNVLRTPFTVYNEQRGNRKHIRRSKETSIAREFKPTHEEGTKKSSSLTTISRTCTQVIFSIKSTDNEGSQRSFKLDL